MRIYSTPPNSTLAILVVLLMCVSPALSAQTIDQITTTSRALMMPRLDPDDPPAAVLYTRPGMEVPSFGTPFNPDDFERLRIQVAAWRDGRIIYSKHLPRGGQPYYSFQVDPRRITNLFSILDYETSVTTLRRNAYQVPDAASQYVVMQRQPSGMGIPVASTHPGVEGNDKIKYSSHGITSADAEVPMTEDEIEFRKFRRDFDHLSAALLALPPTTTTAVAKKLKFFR